MKPGWMHNIINLSDTEDLVTVMWASEMLDKERPVADIQLERGDHTMAKSALEKAIEKQTKEAQKAARQAQIRERASAIVNSQPLVSGFQVMDQDSEITLQAILKAYNGNENNYVGGFDSGSLPKYLHDAVSLEYEKLQMYGMLSNVLQYLSGTDLTITERAKTYFADREAALARAEKEKHSQRRIAEIEAATHTHKKYDVFISHASKDKEEFVDELYRTVRKLGINVFYDTDVLSWGDNWKQVILSGTADSEFAIIVISKNKPSIVDTPVNFQYIRPSKTHRI